MVQEAVKFVNSISARIIEEHQKYDDVGEQINCSHKDLLEPH
jgi:hypothetical protein